MTTAIAPRQGRGYGCRKDENPVCPARVRIVAEPLEADVEGYVIDQWRNPEAIKIARSDDERMMRIREITDEMRHLQEQKNEALRMKRRTAGRAPGCAGLATVGAVLKRLTAVLTQAHRQSATKTQSLSRHDGPAAY
jgi:hypothetical protein